MTYAKIIDGLVDNLFELEPRNAGDFPTAVAADPERVGAVAIGDTYTEGRFYRAGSLVRSQHEIMAEMQAAVEMLLGGDALG